jgi:acyl-CoA synthetase (AMP-forming)/AMP-acid ligase II
VFLSEVESVILKHPLVNEAILFGVPINDYEEELCAWIKLKTESCLSYEEFREHCNKYLVDFKIPKHLKLVNEFPCTNLGKYLRREMQKIFRSELNI